MKKKINLIDIGSIGGLPKELSDNRNKIDKILSFEPFEKDSNNILKQNVAVWNKKCTKDFYIYNSPHGSSLFMQNYEYIGKNYLNLIKESQETKQTKNWFQRSLFVEKKQVNCDTIDNVLQNIDIEFNFLKSDTQGCEYQMLEGAANFLSTDCMGLQLELYNIPIYKDIILKEEVIEFLKFYGFTILKKLSTCGTFASQDEYVFIRDGVNNEYTDTIRKIYETN